MTDINGTWKINGNGSQGLLTLTSNDNVSFNGSVTFDDIGGRTDAVTGSWNEAAGQITFTRSLPGGATQTFTGFLGNNNPDALILAGSFTESDVPANAPRTNFGWNMAPLQPAATYLLSLDKFHITHTRSLHEDTDFAALTLQVLTSVGYEEPLTLSKSFGNVNDGDHAVGLQLAFRLQPNEALTFSYLITNSGFAGSDSQKLRQTLDNISDATKKALDIVYATEAAIWEVANDLTQFLNSIFVANCDGVVAGDKVTKTAAELAQLTSATGSYSEPRRYTRASPHLCGEHDQDYTVTWTITRQ